MKRQSMKKLRELFKLPRNAHIHTHSKHTQTRSLPVSMSLCERACALIQHIPTYNATTDHQIQSMHKKNLSKNIGFNIVSELAISSTCVCVQKNIRCNGVPEVQANSSLLRLRRNWSRGWPDCYHHCHHHVHWHYHHQTTPGDCLIIIMLSSLLLD